MHRKDKHVPRISSSVFYEDRVQLFFINWVLLRASSNAGTTTKESLDLGWRLAFLCFASSCIPIRTLIMEETLFVYIEVVQCLETSFVTLTLTMPMLLALTWIKPPAYPLEESISKNNEFPLPEMLYGRQPGMFMAAHFRAASLQIQSLVKCFSHRHSMAWPWYVSMYYYVVFFAVQNAVFFHNI